MKYTILWFSVVLLIVGVFVGYGFFMFHLFPGVNGPTYRGTFGDMFGALNALFSTLAFAGFIYTIQLQRNDLKLQMSVQAMQLEELEQSRREAKRQGDILDQQRKMLNLQRIESTVLQLVKLLDDIGDKIKYLEDHIHTRSEKPKFTKTFFYLLQFIMNADIPDENKRVFADMINLRLSDEQLIQLYEAIDQDQQKLLLLKNLGFYDRYRKFS